MAAGSPRVSWTGGVAPPTPAVPSGPRSATAEGSGWHLLSVSEIAIACQLSEKAVRRPIDAGELQAVKLRSRLRVTPQDFEDWIAASRRRASGKRDGPSPRRERRPPSGTFRALARADEHGAVEL
jgi:excisionase family DNA binding protein